jgi:hypothetical protein
MVTEVLFCCVFLLSNFVALLLATFDMHKMKTFLLGENLFIDLEGFYMGSASLKTSPPQGVPLVRKRVQAQKVERKES